MFYTPSVRALPPSLTRAIENKGIDLTVLVVRLGAMGDVLRTIPAVRLLRRAIPRARIFWAVEERWETLLRNHRDLNGLLPLQRRRWDGLLRAPAQWLRLIGEITDFRQNLRDLSPEVAIDFHGNLRSGIVCLSSGAQVRLGYEGHQQKEGNRFFMTHRLPSGDRRTPRMDRNLALVGQLGIEYRLPPNAALPLVESGAEAAAEAIDLLPDPLAPFAVIAPGASPQQAYKKPPAELLAAACHQLHERKIACLVVYGPGEEADARRVVAVAAGSATLAPPTKLSTLAALLSRARIFVGGDSGPLHMACAVSCPVVGIYGPTDPVVNQPWGVPFRTVFPPRRAYTGIKRLDRGSGGFAGLNPDHVRAAVAELSELPRDDPTHSMHE
jgi:ADP-heptose:LPS heptosyltransferase